MILPSLRFFGVSPFLARCSSGTADPKEVRFYNKHAEEWWDPKGPFALLLKFNAIRIPFIERQVVRALGKTREDGALQDVRVLDVGCGGGFLSEGLAEKGAKVVGIDVSVESIKVCHPLLFFF